MDQIIEVINQALAQEGEFPLRGPVASSHGGEYVGACIRCKRLYGNGGTKHFRVWPARPVYGNGSRDEPCFWCRECRLDSGKSWSGDLVQYVQYVYDLSFPEACALLGIESVTSNKREVLLKTSLTATGAPDVAWQERAFQFVSDAFDRLWSPEGEPYRRYLSNRGLTEETMKWAGLGCVTEESYEDGLLWGFVGKMKIPRGIVFPEFHRVSKDTVDYREIWSVAIRLSDQERLMRSLEEEVDIKEIPKYYYLTKSKKGLYLSDTIRPGKPAVIVEGQMCALTIKQESGDLVSVGATLSATGSRNLLWFERLNLADFVLVGMDDDTSGDTAREYWVANIRPDKRIWWNPKGMDFNAYHQNGGSIRDFIQRGIGVHDAIKMPLREATDGSTIAVLEDVPLTITEALSFVSEPNRSIEHDTNQLQEDIEARGCVKRLGSITCGRHVAFIDENQQGWCTDHQPLQETYDSLWPHMLLEYGEKIAYIPFDYDSGTAIVGNVKHENVPGGRVAGGRESYDDFLQKAQLSSIALAAVTSRRLWILQNLPERPASPLLKKAEKKVVTEPCSRFSCGRQWSEPYQAFIQQIPDEDGKIRWNSPYKYEPWYGIQHVVGGIHWLQWCPKCRAGYNLLELGQYLGFPKFKEIGEGLDSWVHVARMNSDFDNTRLFDDLRLKHKDRWNELAVLLNEE